VTFDDLGPQLFRDERFDEDNQEKDHPLNEARAAGATIMVSGDNFGCGSSREHAPQSIHKAGFEGIVAGSFAEIFFGNATTLGMACVTLTPEDLGELQGLLTSNPALEVTIDVEALEVQAGDRVFPAGLPSGARQSLLEGRWDPLTDLLAAADDTKALVEQLGYQNGMRGRSA
jgi:3-isopropylmalate/(R)-2-methylmalate dehydratase small subunit